MGESSGGDARVGMTDYAQKQLGDVVYSASGGWANADQG